MLLDTIVPIVAVAEPALTVVKAKFVADKFVTSSEAAVKEVMFRLLETIVPIVAVAELALTVVKTKFVAERFVIKAFVTVAFDELKSVTNRSSAIIKF